MIYKINTTVKSVEFLHRNVRGRMVDKVAVIDTEPLGWFALKVPGSGFIWAMRSLLSSRVRRSRSPSRGCE